MVIVGELINSTRKAIAKAIEDKDGGYVKKLARDQAEAGAAYIDVNSAASGREIENMKWLVEIIRDEVDTPLCIDSPSVEALRTGLECCRQKAMVNSISAEKERWDGVLPLVLEHRAAVIALCMEEGRMPETAEERLEIADKLVSGLTSAGVPEDDIYLDPLIKPLGVNHSFGLEVLEATRLIREQYPQVHIISGLSNVSFGLPERRLLNRTFMVMNVAMGMDAFILDPLDRGMMSSLAAAQALAGQDEYCMNYISGVRSGIITH